MFAENKTTFLRREILTRIASLLFEHQDAKAIDKLPAQIIPRDAEPYRCCIFKDRELIRQRAIAALGFSVDDEAEVEQYLLSEYADMAFQREQPTFPILTFLDDACRACVRANYTVTNICQNCVARPCMLNCPKNAIALDERKARIDPNACVNCGICMKVCPFHAIIYVPVPCEAACPVGAIHKDEHGREDIDYHKCIFCGKCTRECPFGAVMEKSQIVDVIMRLRQERPVAAMIAPAIVGQFQASFGQLVAALKRLGFRYVVEVALGADKTAIIESVEFAERMERGDHVMGTSCCPAYIEAVKKHAPAFQPFVSHAKTPMAYTADIVKHVYPEAVRVFIGPCIAKKHEGLLLDDVDYVLTFEELASLFKAKQIAVEQIQEEMPADLHPASSLGRGFPMSGGVANALKATASGADVIPAYINGFSRKNVKLLQAYAKKCPGNLVEVMSCEGGCVGGPGVLTTPQSSAALITQFLKNA